MKMKIKILTHRQDLYAQHLKQTVRCFFFNRNLIDENKSRKRRGSKKTLE